jgi:arginyl-tRNA synthetase
VNILAELRRRFTGALSALTPEPLEFAGLVKPSQDERFGDYQANCAMPLASRQRTQPRVVAERIVAGLDVADMCQPPEIAGPGFINLRLRDDWIAAAVNRLVADERLAVDLVDEPKTVLIDYSAPNVAKPMHVGHLRSTVIGAALDRLFRFVGHRVITDNHIGDWGTQFGMIIYGYKHFLDRDAFARSPVTELSRLYRLVHQLSDYHDAVQAIPELKQRLEQAQRACGEAQARAREATEKAARAEADRLRKKATADAEALREELAAAEAKRRAVDDDPALRRLAAAHPDVAVESRRETARLHAGDPENRRLWEEFLPPCLNALSGVYDRLEIRFDMTLGESFYQPLLAGVVDELRQAGIAEESDGAICVFIENNVAPFIIRKSDGAFTYATSDLATIRYRAATFGADVILYVVDARQAEHFRLLFATARQWGYGGIDFRHVSFGTILGEDKRPFKTRSGDTVGLESLLDEAVARARRIVDENDDAKDAPELDDQTRAAVAEAVGIGGIKYADLRHNRDSDYVFQWEKMLATTGDTATYIQYSFARICGIFRKGDVDRGQLRGSGAAIRLSHPAERKLALDLLQFPEAVAAAVEECRPNAVAHYLFQAADDFTKFYEACSVLKEPDPELRASRLLLCDLTARVLEKGLWLLGIRACEKM